MGGGSVLGMVVISYQLSAISYQLSAISYQLSAISYQLSAISKTKLGAAGGHGEAGADEALDRSIVTDSG
jgi:hypothetical protein